MKVPRLSNIDTKDGAAIQECAMYKPPATSELKWHKRCIPLECNMKLWRDTVRRIFCVINEINPHYIGYSTPIPTQRDMLQDALSYNAVLAQYDQWFISIIGTTTFGEDQVREIISLFKSGKLCTGSNGSEKCGRGSHVCGFSNAHKEREIWGGYALAPGSKIEMLSLRAEHSGAISILLILYADQMCMGGRYDHSQYHLVIWMDNAEVLTRGGMKYYGESVKSRLVLDYDMWTVMTMLQEKNKFKLQWEKVDAHTDT